MFLKNKILAALLSASLVVSLVSIPTTTSLAYVGEGVYSPKGSPEALALPDHIDTTYVPDYNYGVVTCFRNTSWGVLARNEKGNLFFCEFNGFSLPGVSALSAEEVEAIFTNIVSKLDLYFASTVVSSGAMMPNVICYDRVTEIPKHTIQTIYTNNNSIAYKIEFTDDSAQCEILHEYPNSMCFEHYTNGYCISTSRFGAGAYSDSLFISEPSPNTFTCLLNARFEVASGLNCSEHRDMDNLPPFVALELNDLIN